MIDICCDKLKEELENENLLTVLDVKPFSKIPSESILYLISDGEHGGLKRAIFCPFCGTKIRSI